MSAFCLGIFNMVFFALFQNRKSVPLQAAGDLPRRVLIIQVYIYNCFFGTYRFHTLIKARSKQEIRDSPNLISDFYFCTLRSAERIIGYIQ